MYRLWAGTDTKSGQFFVRNCKKEAATATKTADSTKTLVVYFSVTGNTAKVGDMIADALKADKYVIKPVKEYTKEDLNYNNETTRAMVEQKDDKARPEIAGDIKDVSQYDTIYIGYPIWWGFAPKIMYTFVEKCDLSGKKVVPFCTSGGSDIGSSAEVLAEVSKGKAKWAKGKCFSTGVTKEEIQKWVETNK